MVSSETVNPAPPPYSTTLRSDLAQNWNIDVAHDLEEYLDELADVEISFDGGKTSLNFAQAALLIQGSACIYSRKVEYLYTLIYRTLDMITTQSRRGKVGRRQATGRPPDYDFFSRDASIPSRACTCLDTSPR